MGYYIFADDIATGEAARMSDARDWSECQDIFNHWFYCFNCRYETLSANWNTLESNATLTLLRMVRTGPPAEATFARTTETTPKIFEALVKFEFPLQL